MNRILIAFSSSALLLGGVAHAKAYEAVRGESSLTYVLVTPLHTVKGVTRDFLCAVELSDDTLSSRVRVSADVRTFDSGNSSRDSHAMELIESRKYPRVVFESAAVKRDGGGYAVAGDLTFHGRTRPVAFRVNPSSASGKVRITGTFEVKLSEFDVKSPRLMFMPSEDKLTLRFDLVAKE